MQNLINLEAPLKTPVLPNSTAQAGTYRKEGALFNAILMNQMHSPGMDVATDREFNADLGRGLVGNSTLMNLAPAFVAQQQQASAKSSSAAQDGLTNTSAAGDSITDPALAMWMAAIAALQLQSNVALNPDDIGKQIAGAGVDAPSVMPTNTLMLPKLFPPGTDVNAPVLRPAPTPPNVHSELNPKDLQNTAIAPVIETPATDLALNLARLNAAPTSPEGKVPGATDKNKNDRQDIGVNPVLANDKPDASLPALQSQSSDSKSQPQTSSEQQQSHSGKSPASAEPLQLLAGQLQTPGGAATSQIDQGSLNAAAQASVHGVSTAHVQDQTISSDVSHPSGLRDYGGIAVIDSAPRIVHATKIMEAAEQAEMRVSMKSETAGTVDVRAVLEGSHISATVAAQHGGTRDWLVQQQSSGAQTQFRKNVHATTGVFGDLEINESTSQALSLHA